MTLLHGFTYLLVRYHILCVTVPTPIPKSTAGSENQVSKRHAEARHGVCLELLYICDIQLQARQLYKN